jgi:hypothetical protein
MVLADDDDAKFHPYWYARVIGVFHAMVCFNSPRAKAREMQRIEFLWVRWYGIDFDSDTIKSAFEAKRMYQVGFLDGDSDEAFGFINPSDVLRAVHLIPSFVNGYRSEIRISPLARRPEENNQDYIRYYINM